MRRRIMKVFAVSLLALAACVVPASVVGACPNCKEALNNNDSGGNPARGYYYSILTMLGAPFVLGGVFTTILLNSRRKQLKERKAAGDIAPPAEGG
ncbi:MAG: hypothetical protein HY719_02655 [Planctomycetes bacterium]|nr:hypothetical protein [Planctomycetota bacterium]